MQPQATSPADRLKPWGWGVLVFALTLTCYWPALRGSLLWDDPAHVTRPELRSWAGLGRIWSDMRATQQYYPVLHSAFWVEHRLWGDATLGYHLLNVLLHATSACLFAGLLQRLWRTPSAPVAPGGVPLYAAWLAALIFAVHPVNVESVAWISEQKNTLSLVFYLLAALAYFNFSTDRKLSSYVMATGLFVLALGTKSVTATLPAALLVGLWWKKGTLSVRRDLVPLLPWFALAVTAGLFTAWVERNIIGAEGAHFNLSVMERGLLAGRVIWFYLGSLLWPRDLAFFYARWNVPDAATGWSGYLLATVAVTSGLLAIHRRTRGPLAGWLLFVGSLFPALGFFNVYPFIFSYVADHFQYLADLGLIAPLTAGLAMALARSPRWIRQTGWTLAGVAVVALVVLSNRQSQQYRDNEILARATLARTPDSWIAHHLLAVTLAKSPDGRTEAIAHYQESLRLNPDYPDAHVGLAVELARRPEGRTEAIAHYEQALQLRPRYAEAHNNLAVELSSLPGRQADELVHYEAALQIKPDFAEAHANFARALAKIPGRQPEALAHYATALQLKPNYAEAHYGLANLLTTLPGRMTDALGHYETALQLNPTLVGAQLNLAVRLSQIPGREQEAVAHAEEAVRLSPDNAEAQNGLAIIYARQGQLDRAKSHWEKALQLDPRLEAARKNLRLLDDMTRR